MRTSHVFGRVVSFVVLFLLSLSAVGGCRSTSTSASSCSQVFRSECVAADHADASQAGAEILAAGGNAVDAAVATSFALSVVRPYSCGIGGGGFMIVHIASHQTLGPLDEAWNYRETCPAAVGRDFFEQDADKHASTCGAKAVAIPGTVAGLLCVHHRHGLLDRAAVLAPAIRLAESGFIVDDHYLAAAAEIAEKFEANPTWKSRFSFVWERYLRHGRVRPGDRIVNPEQAAALRLIAAYGAEAFYHGPIAEAIVRAVEQDGGRLTAADLASYKPKQVDPLRRDFLGRSLLTMPPPSSGGVALAEILGILEASGRIRGDGTDASDARYYHALIESMKHAFADRARWLADPDFADVPVAMLLDPAMLRRHAQAITPDSRHPIDSYGTQPLTPTSAVPEDHGTSHLCVVDRFGNAVACTETINLEFGSLLAVEPYGFCLNNEMDDFLTRRGESNAFNLTQADANLPAPGKRPLSSMTPTIVLDEGGHVEFVVGASGGPRIISGVAQVLLNAIVFHEPPRRAVALQRIHHQWKPDVVSIEPIDLPGLSPQPCLSHQSLLESWGHSFRQGGAVANVQAIGRQASTIDPKPSVQSRFTGWEAACDPRKGGRPAGN